MVPLGSPLCFPRTLAMRFSLPFDSFPTLPHSLVLVFDGFVLVHLRLFVVDARLDAVSLEHGHVVLVGRLVRRRRRRASHARDSASRLCRVGSFSRRPPHGSPRGRQGEPPRPPTRFKIAQPRKPCPVASTAAQSRQVGDEPRPLSPSRTRSDDDHDRLVLSDCAQLPRLDRRSLSFSNFTRPFRSVFSTITLSLSCCLYRSGIVVPTGSPPRNFGLSTKHPPSFLSLPF